MPIIKEPLYIKCSQCNREFLVKFSAPRKSYSKKNDWDFWTEKEEDKDKKYCDDCLLFSYRNLKWKHLKLITNKKKQFLFSQYVCKKIITSNEKKPIDKYIIAERERERERENKITQLLQTTQYPINYSKRW